MFIGNTGTTVPLYDGPSIETFLEPFGKYDLLEYMNKYVSLGSLASRATCLRFGKEQY